MVTLQFPSSLARSYWQRELSIISFAIWKGNSSIFFASSIFFYNELWYSGYMELNNYELCDSWLAKCWLPLFQLVWINGYPLVCMSTSLYAKRGPNTVFLRISYVKSKFWRIILLYNTGTVWYNIQCTMYNVGIIFCTMSTLNFWPRIWRRLDL